MSFEVSDSRTHYDNENHDTTPDYSSTDQAGEGENEIMLEFNLALNKDLNNQENINMLNGLIRKMEETNPDQAESMKQSIIDAKSEQLGEDKIEA